MSQSADEHDKSWRSPWAAPTENEATAPLPAAAPATATAVTTPPHGTPTAGPAGGSTEDGPPSQPYPAQPYPAQPYPAQPYPGQPYPGQPSGAGTYGGSAATPQPDPWGAAQQVPPTASLPTASFPTASFPTATPTPRRPRRGPGWVALIAAAGGSALLASLLTAGIVKSVDANSTSGQSTSSSQSSTPKEQVSGPVTSSTAANPDWAKVAAAVESSVVAVKVTMSQGGGEGSGVILDKAGHILTNNHVVSGAQSIVVVLGDGRGYDASVVGTDASTDIAVIKLNKAPSDLVPATLGDSSTVKVGDPVMAVGNPLGLSDTVTTGIVSAVNRPVSTSSSEQQDPFGGTSGAGESAVTDAIQTDAAVNPGNSGGALLDVQGRVIGVTSSIASLGSSLGAQSGSIGLGFAIPINQVKDVAQQLVSSGKVQHAYMGVNLQEKSVTVDGAMRAAAVVADVTANSPAGSAGLKAGDAIIAIDGKTVSGADSLVAQVRERRPGTKAALTVVRNGSAQQIVITLGTHPSS